LWIFYSYVVVFSFIRDRIVVKALEDIPEGGEILNCYGIDYRALDRNQRQIACLETYRFVCKCEICEDPLKEIGDLDSFKCTKCQGALPKVPESESLTPCDSCHITFFTECLRIARIKAQRHFNLAQEDAANRLNWLMRCLKLRDKVLYKNHEEMEELYLAFFKYFLENDDPLNTCKYFRLWLDIQKAWKGENSRTVGVKLFETALAVLVCCIKTHPRNLGSL
ncbi:uncharacterized protein LOC111692728, partial [Anoplophora glabripennis]|uniref:uncharacterized protein LOC111692728 n=1 Tax=Anoplophora glabripennis TaxID=217634 RepID=UPI000C7951DB